LQEIEAVSNEEHDYALVPKNILNVDYLTAPFDLDYADDNNNDQTDQLLFGQQAYIKEEDLLKQNYMIDGEGSVKKRKKNKRNKKPKVDDSTI
jgi:hypothetical protein